MRDQLSRYSVSEDEYLAWVDSPPPDAGSRNAARRGPDRRHGTREPRVRARAARERRSRRSSDAGGYRRGHRARLCARRLRKRGLPAHRPGRRARARDRAGGERLGPELLPLRSRHGHLRRRRHVRDLAARSRPHLDELARRAMAQRVAARPTVAAGVRLLPADRRAPAVLRATDLVIPREDRRHLPGPRPRCALRVARAIRSGRRRRQLRHDHAAATRLAQRLARGHGRHRSSGAARARADDGHVVPSSERLSTHGTPSRCRRTARF